MKPTEFVSVLATLTGCARAEWQFRSRPDLSPPRLNITIPATDDVSPGFIFVTPYSSFKGPALFPEQPAAYILRDDGDLVWSSLGYLSGFVANFQATRYQGQPVLQAFQGTIDSRHGRGHGTLQILDDQYRPVAQVQSLTNKIPSLHELRIVNEKTALVEIYDPVPYDLTAYGGSEGQNWIVDSILQEVDIETGELIYEVHSLDIVSPAGRTLLLAEFRSHADLYQTVSLPYLQEPPSTHPMPGTIFTSTASTRTTKATTSSQPGTQAPSISCPVAMAPLSGSLEVIAPPLSYRQASTLAASTMRASLTALPTARSRPSRSLTTRRRLLARKTRAMQRYTLIHGR